MTARRLRSWSFALAAGTFAASAAFWSPAVQAQAPAPLPAVVMRKSSGRGAKAGAVAPAQAPVLLTHG